jgi:hypothetical protein
MMAPNDPPPSERRREKAEDAWIEPEEEGKLM